MRWKGGGGRDEKFPKAYINKNEEENEMHHDITRLEHKSVK